MPTYQTFQWRRRRFVVPVIIAGLVGSLAIALSLSASLSGFAATITNSSNTAASAANLTIQENSGLVQCNSYDSSATCNQIDKYGGTASPLVPGGTSQSVTVAFTNTSSTPATGSTLTGGLCSASTNTSPNTAVTAATTDPGNLCSQMRIVIYKGATTSANKIYEGNPNGLTTPIDLGPLAVNVAQSYTFVVSLPSGSTTALGQKILQSLTWNFSA